MCHLSPTVHLGWALLACGLQIVLVQHLWRYDRFKCLKWTSGRQPGAFKRVMTYSYCASVPLLLLYSVAMAVLKYRHGYAFIPGHGIIPTPYILWPESDRSWLIPLLFIFSIVWALEIVTHMEELMFWLFLIHQGPTKRDWFSSIEFKLWAITSVLGMGGMPVAVIFAKSDPLKAEAYVFLAGSSASTCITGIFFLVLIKFPEFLRRVKKEGAAGAVVLRLVKFHELNIMRIIFRLLFTLPILCLGVDGVLHHHTLNESALWTDTLAFIAAFGAVISSTLTLLIFFPRSLAEDSNFRPISSETQTHGSLLYGTSGQERHGSKLPYSEQSPNPFLTPRDTTSPEPMQLSKTKTKYYSGHFTSPSALTTPYYPPDQLQGDDWNLRDTEEGRSEPTDHHKYGPMRIVEPPERDDERRHGSKRDTKEMKVRMMELGKVVDAGMKKPVRPPRLHPYIATFTSPIDLLNNIEAPRAV